MNLEHKMDFNQALNYIHEAHKFGIKLGLENIRTLMDIMGDPHKKLKYVHIAGTNGKGSTAAYITNILVKSGYNVGMYTSPFIERFTERIKINNIEISDSDLTRLTEFVKNKIAVMLAYGHHHPTEFEIVTAIAFQYFSENNCDIVVLETGLGGRFDSTNIISTPLVAVITTIGYDHIDKLGNTLNEIAFEKAGIIKTKGDVVLYPAAKEVEQVFEHVCQTFNATLHYINFDNINVKSFGLHSEIFDYGAYKDLKIPLLGDHQMKNAILSIHVSEILKSKGFDKITETSIHEGLNTVKWPGRFEILHKFPTFIVDGAHNQEGAIILTESLKKYFPERKIIFIMGILLDKQVKTIVQTVTHMASEFILVTPHNNRAMPAEELAVVIREFGKKASVCDSVIEAIELSLKIATSNDVICAFGSLYYIGDVRKYFI